MGALPPADHTHLIEPAAPGIANETAHQLPPAFVILKIRGPLVHKILPQITH